ncbi:hypothetical protein PZH37_18140, partial [[Eubacterium] siraeum]|nr:hypothetical protein [[Eubacterium] siraeum]
PQQYSPGTDAGRVCRKALQDAKPTKHTQPFTEGKGLGDRDREFTLLYKNHTFLQADPPANTGGFVYFLY